MRLLLQRVTEASVSVDNSVISSISKGLLVFVAFCASDTASELNKLSRKLLELRIFSDSQGKMNLSVQDIHGELLVVSQFTLFADCRRGRRPDFIQAAPPRQAEELYNLFISELHKSGLNVQAGIFAADMQVSLVNDGPVTIWLDSEQL
jgi:D-aminoacyl-tRNA deacylase